MFFWVVTPCSSGGSPTFRINIPPTSSELRIKTSKKPSEAGGKLFFAPENVGNMFLRNVGLSPDYTASYPRRSS
jgi:hypothetical protein